MKSLMRLLVLWVVAVSLGLPPAYAEARTEEVASLIKSLQVGRPFNYENLTIVPIYSSSASNREDYITLDEAVNKGYILITELEGGRVPQVKVTNKSDRYVYLLAGEILTGARQNRLVGKDVLLGPHNKEVIVPVYCVEHGRWSGGYEFGSKGIVAAPMFRSYAAAGFDQGRMWDGVAEYSAKVGVSSPTQDLTMAYSDSKVQEECANYVSALEDIPRLEDDAVGVAVIIGGRIATVDIFGNAQLFADLWPKLLRSYAMGAIAEDYDYGEKTKDSQQEVRAVLRQLHERGYERKEGIALGQELSLSTDEITSAALVYNGWVIHLSAFPNKGERGPVMPKGHRIPVLFD